ncbi:MAG: hypothetical protein O9284_06715 [Steroidobacteraceae bacterium]|jgi:hypothetical protein|nr:hypothetical protein [Steroidobacteraceae bacterium]
MTARGIRTAGKATPTNAATFATATLQAHGGIGIGVNIGGESSPNHAMDNDGPLEFVLLQFSTTVNVRRLDSGWVGRDSDISLLAFTGPVATNTVNAALASLTSQNVGSLLGFGLAGAAVARRRRPVQHSRDVTRRATRAG